MREHDYGYFLGQPITYDLIEEYAEFKGMKQKEEK